MPCHLKVFPLIVAETCSRVEQSPPRTERRRLRGGVRHLAGRHGLGMVALTGDDGSAVDSADGEGATSPTAEEPFQYTEEEIKKMSWNNLRVVARTYGVPASGAGVTLETLRNALIALVPRTTDRELEEEPDGQPGIRQADGTTQAAGTTQATQAAGMTAQSAEPTMTLQMMMQFMQQMEQRAARQEERSERREAELRAQIERERDRWDQLDVMRERAEVAPQFVSKAASGGALPGSRVETRRAVPVPKEIMQQVDVAVPRNVKLGDAFTVAFGGAMRTVTATVPPGLKQRVTMCRSSRMVASTLHAAPPGFRVELQLPIIHATYCESYQFWHSLNDTSAKDAAARTEPVLQQVQAGLLDQAAHVNCNAVLGITFSFSTESSGEKGQHKSLVRRSTSCPTLAPGLLTDSRLTACFRYRPSPDSGLLWSLCPTSLRLRLSRSRRNLKTSKPCLFPVRRNSDSHSRRSSACQAACLSCRACSCTTCRRLPAASAEADRRRRPRPRPLRPAATLRPEEQPFRTTGTPAAS